MSKTIKYRIAARTDAAGKFNPDAPQEGNEDNYGLICDVAHPDRQAGFDEAVDLGPMGLLMFVADGMGGHNAGEVASKIAVDTVAEAFAEGKVNPGIAGSHQARSLYMEGVIRDADKRIRSHAHKHKECEGMGSTLLIAWLVGNELTVSWCGDSRCYLYRPQPEPRISMVSEDHSYVQELVQRGVIPYEATFAHPNGNIITRCLGGGEERSDPESRLAYVGKGDIILLCSDGLSGVLFDDGRLFDGDPISEENICDVITMHRSSLRESVQELFLAAERQNWYDNVTTILCEVVEAPAVADEWPPVVGEQTPQSSVIPELPRRKLTWLWISLAILGIALGVAAGYMLAHSSEVKHVSPADTIVTTDTILPPGNADSTTALKKPATGRTNQRKPGKDGTEEGTNRRDKSREDAIKEIIDNARMSSDSIKSPKLAPEKGPSVPEQAGNILSNSNTDEPEEQ
ncbi:MAG: serine/threonine-protein phosphatase [Bacteroidales bacterium]|nr:serine/threonine-protein phosphatase [Bacteroidales bacterium]